MLTKSSKSDDDANSSILDLIERVGEEATKLTRERLASVRTPKAEKQELDRIASEIAIELNADPEDEEVQRLAVFQAAAKRLTKGECMNELELRDKELALTYGLEPTTIENLKATRPGWEKTLGRKVTLEEVYFLEIDQPE